jgi:LysM repeat protein
VKAAPRQQSPRTPAEIIRLINKYRAENGLPAYVQNSILMGTAQDQSDYQAAIGSVTHEGPGGSRPRDRAYAAGYGDGKIIWISEIIYGYTSGTPEDAVNWWKTSEIHNYTMLAPQYKDIGAGVAVSNNRYYFTAVVGWISIYDNPDATPTTGPSPTASKTPEDTEEKPTKVPSKTPSKTTLPSKTSIPPSATASHTAGPSPTATYTATALPPGAITHVVKAGDTLSLIADRYGISLEELLALNNLTLTAIIYPGDILFIQLAPTATLTETASATLTQTDTATTSPSATANHTTSTSLSATPSKTPAAGIAAPEPINSPFITLDSAEYRALIAIALFGFTLLPLGILLYRFESRRRT